MTAPPPRALETLAPLLEGHARVLLVTPSVEHGLFSYAIRHGLELAGPWTSHYAVPPLNALPDPAERERALRDYFAGVVAGLRRDPPDLVLFSPSTQALGRRTLHDVFVTELRLFPVSGWRLGQRTDDGWHVYAPAPPAQRRRERSSE